MEEFKDDFQRPSPFFERKLLKGLGKMRNKLEGTSKFVGFTFEYFFVSAPGHMQQTSLAA